MKSFIYTRTDKKNRNGYTVYTLHLYRIIRGTPHFLGVDQDTFCSEFQQCRSLMRKLNVWPKAADAVDEHGRQKYHYPYELRDARVVNIHQV